MGTGAGDKLARGAAKAAFPASEPGITQEKFDQAVNDFDPQAFLKNAEKAEEEARVRRTERILAEQADAEQLDRDREERRRQESVEA